MLSIIKLKRIHRGKYRYKDFVIIQDHPSNGDYGYGLGTGNGFWLIYQDGDDEPITRTMYLWEMRDWIKENEREWTK